MIKKLMIVLMSCALFACDLVKEAEVVSDNLDQKKMWVFAQFNVPQKGDKIEDYYYYGRVSEALFKKIKENKINQGFILLENIKYWGDDDLVYDYADNEDVGSMLFRIEDIRRIRLIKVEPIAGKGAEQFDDDLAIESTPIDDLPQAEVVPTENTLPVTK